MSVVQGPSGTALPDRFLWGVSVPAFPCEGGYNGIETIKNNWFEFEITGRVGRSGGAAGFFEHWEEYLDLAVGAGLNMVRLGVEWARMWPTRTPGSASAPEPDALAFDAYARMIAGARSRGLEPFVSLIHFSLPVWLPADFWLDVRTCRPAASAYAAETVRQLNARLIDRHGQPPLRFYVTLNQPFILALNTYQLKRWPRGMKREPADADFSSCFRNQLEAHCAMYDAIHRAHAEAGWPEPVVGWSEWCAGVPEAHLLPLVLLSRPHIDEAQAQQEYAGLRESTDAEAERMLAAVGGRTRAKNERFFRDWFRERLDFAGYERLRRGIQARERWLDAIFLDFHAPFFTDFLVFSGILGRKEIQPWEWRVCDDLLLPFLRIYRTLGLPIYLTGGGVATRRDTDGPGSVRRDRIGRAESIERHLDRLSGAVGEGIDLRGFVAGQLVDGYEWGSLLPRFGLIGMDYARDRHTAPFDSNGEPALGRLAQRLGSVREG